MKRSYILEAIFSEVWAILPSKLAVIIDLAERHAAGERLSAEQIAEVKAAAQRAPVSGGGAVAVIPVVGTIIGRADSVTESSGAISTQRIAAMFRQAQADPGVGAIIFDIDSPGGGVSGVDELAAEIMAARGGKPVYAISNHMCASAAYWIGTAAEQLWVSPSSETGSIGVFAAHADMSKAYEMAGVNVNLIQAGRFKTEGNPYAPLTDEARAAIQSRVDDYYQAFTKAVAKGRGVGIEAVRSGFGEGRVLGAREAVAQGMADHIGTLDELVAEAMKKKKMPAKPMMGAQAQAELLRDRLALL